MITIKQFADEIGKPVATVYSWIYRNQTKKNGFTTVKIGSITMIKKIKQ